jgi:hypothetical protein
MSAVQEPERWLTAKDELAAELRPALRMAQAEGPSARERDRMWNALGGKLPLLAAGESELAASSRERVEATSPRPGGLPAWWWLVGTGVVAAVIGYVAATAVHLSPTDSPSAGRPSAPEHRFAEHDSIAPVSPVTKDATTDRIAAPAPVIDPPRRSERSARPRGRTTPAAVLERQSTPASSADLAAELELLARARRVIAVDPERALQLTAEHARRYQTGVLAQEREVLAIDALQRLGHRELAAARAARFIARYPDSAHRLRIAAELDAQ